MEMKRTVNIYLKEGQWQTKSSSRVYFTHRCISGACQCLIHSRWSEPDQNEWTLSKYAGLILNMSDLSFANFMILEKYSTLTTWPNPAINWNVGRYAPYLWKCYCFLLNALRPLKFKADFPSICLPRKIKKIDGIGWKDPLHTVKEK